MRPIPSLILLLTALWTSAHGPSVAAVGVTASGTDPCLNQLVYQEGVNVCAMPDAQGHVEVRRFEAVPDDNGVYRRIDGGPAVLAVGRVRQVLAGDPPTIDRLTAINGWLSVDAVELRSLGLRIGDDSYLVKSDGTVATTSASGHATVRNGGRLLTIGSVFVGSNTNNGASLTLDTGSSLEAESLEVAATTLGQVVGTRWPEWPAPSCSADPVPVCTAPSPYEAKVALKNGSSATLSSTVSVAGIENMGAPRHAELELSGGSRLSTDALWIGSSGSGEVILSGASDLQANRTLVGIGTGAGTHGGLRLHDSTARLGLLTLGSGSDFGGPPGAGAGELHLSGLGTVVDATSVRAGFSNAEWVRAAAEITVTDGAHFRVDPSAGVLSIGTNNSDATLDVSLGGRVDAGTVFIGLEANARGRATLFGGSLAADNLRIGLRTGSLLAGSGRMNVGHGSTVTVSNDTLVGGEGGHGELDLGPGGTTSPVLFESNTLNVGRGTGARGHVRVDHNASLVTRFANIGIDGGEGEAHVLGGTDGLLVSETLHVGRGAGSEGLLTVARDGRVATRNLNLGREGGKGEIRVEGEIAVGEFANVGRSASTGPGLHLKSGSALTVGQSLSVGRGADNGSLLAEHASLRFGDALLIGREGGFGAVTLSEGALMEGKALTLGLDPGSEGQLFMGGTDTRILLTGVRTSGNSPALVVGLDGKATATVTGGASVRIDRGADAEYAVTTGGLFVGGSGNSSSAVADGKLTISEGASVEIAHQRALVQVAQSGEGRLEILAGGKLTSANADEASVGTVGRKPGAEGSVLVSGSGSEWNLGASGSRLYLGLDTVSSNIDVPTASPGGRGRVRIEHQGMLTVGQVYVGNESILEMALGGTVNGSVNLLFGGTLQGDAIVTRNLGIVGGLLKPGFSPGAVTVGGDLYFESGILELESQAGVLDRILVAGRIEIGSLAVIRLFYDTVPESIYLPDFFAGAVPLFDPEFSAANLKLFTTDTGQAGQQVWIDLGGEGHSITAVAVAPVPLPPAVLLLASALLWIAGTRIRKGRSARAASTGGRGTAELRRDP